MTDTPKCGNCGGALPTPVKRKCHMPKEERGWDYWTQCPKCKRGYFGYTEAEAIRRCTEARK